MGVSDASATSSARRIRQSSWVSLASRPAMLLSLSTLLAREGAMGEKDQHVAVAAGIVVPSCPLGGQP